VRGRIPELATALALDALLREPPVRLHPVVWTGRLLDVLEARLPGADAEPCRARRAGALAWCAGAGVVLAVALAAGRLPWPLRGALLWGLLSGRLLLDEVAAVERALREDGPDAGRERLRWLVSRDTAGLSPALVRAGAISTLAENAGDAWVATLWWWCVGGLPAAALHRFADTADSRWGQRTARFEDVGRTAAHADDVLAWVPARLTALAWRGRLDAALREQARRTPSPNGGWPMGAAALGLGVELAKPGTYVLNPGAPEPGPDDVEAALAAGRRVLATTAAAALVAAALRDRTGRGDRAWRGDRAGVAT